MYSQSGDIQIHISEQFQPEKMWVRKSISFA